jgi:hypothetical protein
MLTTLPSLFRLFRPKDQTKSLVAQTSQSTLYRPQSHGFGFAEAERHYSAIFEKAIAEYQKNLANQPDQPTGIERLVMAPNFGLYAAMYGAFDAVASNINFLAAYLPAWHIHDWAKTKDKKGEINTLVTQEIEKRWKLSNLIKKALKQSSLYGIRPYTKFHQPNGQAIYTLLPASEMRNFVVSTDTWQIRRFSWSDGRVWNYKDILDIDETGHRNFYIGREEDSDDQIFGTPKLRALFTIMDGSLRDNELYRNWLENAAKPGIIAMVPDLDSEGLIMELDAAFRALRDPDSAYKAQTVKGIGVVGNTIGRKVEFVTIRQEIENRLSIDEKREIDDKVKDALGIPRAIFGFKQSGGMGSNEYESAMVAFKEGCLDDLCWQLKSDLDSFFIPDMLTTLEQEGWFKKMNIQVNYGGKIRIATAADFHFEFEEVRVEQPSILAAREQKRQQLVMQGYLNGAITAAEMRDVLDFDKPTQADFNFTIYQAQMVKEWATPGQSLKLNEATDVQDPSTNTRLMLQSNLTPNQISDLVQTKAVKWKALKTAKKIQKFFEEITKAERTESVIPRVLGHKDVKDLTVKIQAALNQQAKEAPIAALLGQLAQPIDPNDPNLKNQLKDLIKANLVPLDHYLNVEDMIAKMIVFAKLGQEEAVQQAQMANQEGLTSQQRAQIRGQVTDWIEKRVNNLLGFTSGEANGRITNPYYDGNLDQTTIDDLAQAILVTLMDDPEATLDQIKNRVDQNMQKINQNRSVLIANHNIASVFSLGMYLAAIQLGAKYKTWLHTTSEDPRLEHLQMVGQTVPIDAPFSNGDYWTNILPNCKCGIKLSWQLS